jgi:tetratricopeptide (TPR) repeat protein
MALQIEPNYVKGHYRLGLVYSHFKQNELALKCFRETVRLDPDNKAAKTQIRGLTESGLISLANDDLTSKTIKEVQNGLNRVSLNGSSNQKSNADTPTSGPKPDIRIVESNCLPPVRLNAFRLPDQLPQTQFQFICVWNEVVDDATRSEYLQRIGVERFERLFAKGLEPRLFSELLRAIVSTSDSQFVANLLFTFTRLARFDTLRLFLEHEDKSST